MRVALTHGYFIAEDAKEQAIMKPYVPLGILYIAAFLDDKNIENSVFDSTFSTFEKQVEFLKTYQPQVVAFYTNLMTKVNVLKAIQHIRNTPELKDIKVILGGPEIRYNAENYIHEGADYLVIGEGEQTFYELITAIDKNAQLTEIQKLAGIGLLDKDGNYVFTGEREKMRTLDELPIPARHKIDLSLYLNAWKTHHGESSLSISTMRGCPYTCKWCSRAVYGISYRRRNAALVVQEIKQLVETYHPDSFWFVDDVFTVSHRWLKEFAGEVSAQNAKFQYECITRADRLNDEAIALLKQTGCKRVWIGAESGSQRVIDLMDRRVDVNQVREMIVKTRAAGMEAGTFIMLGYPGETEADIEETIHHLKTSNPDYYTITVSYPIKGTELYQETEASQMAAPEWATSTDRDRDFVRAYPRSYYNYAVKRVYNEVNYHKLKLDNQHYTAKALKMKAKSIAAKIIMQSFKIKHSLS